MSPAHNLEVDPFRAYRLETGQETAPPAVPILFGCCLDDPYRAGLGHTTPLSKDVNSYAQTLQSSIDHQHLYSICIRCIPSVARDLSGAR
jgi:hypothetical protein